MKKNDHVLFPCVVSTYTLVLVLKNFPAHAARCTYPNTKVLTYSECKSDLLEQCLLLMQLLPT